MKYLLAVPSLILLFGMAPARAESCRAEKARFDRAVRALQILANAAVETQARCHYHSPDQRAVDRLTKKAVANYRVVLSSIGRGFLEAGQCRKRNPEVFLGQLSKTVGIYLGGAWAACSLEAERLINSEPDEAERQRIGAEYAQKYVQQILQRAEKPKGKKEGGRR